MVCATRRADFAYDVSVEKRLAAATALGMAACAQGRKVRFFAGAQSRTSFTYSQMTGDSAIRGGYDSACIRSWNGVSMALR